MLRGPSRRPPTLAAAVFFAAALPPAIALTSLAPGCGSVTPSGDAGADGETDAAPEPVVTILHPDADPLPGFDTCEVTITTNIPLDTATHVLTCSAVDYPTNPPSGGPHWPVWLAYTSYDTPVPREMYVHNMEHGAVILLHDCDGACPEVLDAFTAARDVVTGDPLCLQIPAGPTERVVTTPDPLLDVPIAAAAWGATYRATCIDPPSLEAFVQSHYDKATEKTCAQGKLYDSPDSGSPDCDAGLFDASTTTGTGGSTTGTGGTGGTPTTGSTGGTTTTGTGASDAG